MKIIFKESNFFVKSIINKKGFILLDMLFSLFIFLIIVSFLPFFLQIILNVQPIEKQLQNIEWEIFAQQLKKEVRMSESIDVEQNKLLLYIDGENIQYEWYSNKIRRRVNVSGHEVVLQGIETINFSAIANGVKVMVKDQYMQQKEVEVRSYLNL
ncbi:competence type IV pilus minor pilin ComGF [Niallia nealsonii]|uniref:Competence protein comGF n=1 Tax=Niallia nealsonii TaxID=115979 RepID=A0A2N0Z858_9BACI|nr:competence type IV pilus minor pilin ComGF [Niallia nealsonii]PKG25710.1 competence protein comGF [Niallia nealsonii]